MVAHNAPSSINLFSELVQLHAQNDQEWQQRSQANKMTQTSTAMGSMLSLVGAKGGAHEDKWDPVLASWGRVLSWRGKTDFIN